MKKFAKEKNEIKKNKILISTLRNDLSDGIKNVKGKISEYQKSYSEYEEVYYILSRIDVEMNRALTKIKKLGKYGI